MNTTDNNDDANEYLDEIRRLQDENEKLEDTIREQANELIERETTITQQSERIDELIGNYSSEVEHVVCELIYSQFINNKNNNVSPCDNFIETLDECIPEVLLTPFTLPYNRYTSADDYETELNYLYDSLLSILRVSYYNLIDTYEADIDRSVIELELFRHPNFYTTLLLVTLFSGPYTDAIEILRHMDENSKKSHFDIINDTFFRDQKNRINNFVSFRFSDRYRFTRLQYDLSDLIGLASHLYNKSDRSTIFESVFIQYIINSGVPLTIKNAYRTHNLPFISSDLWDVIVEHNSDCIIPLYKGLLNLATFPRNFQDKVNILKIKGEI